MQNYCIIIHLPALGKMSIVLWWCIGFLFATTGSSFQPTIQPSTFRIGAQFDRSIYLFESSPSSSTSATVGEGEDTASSSSGQQQQASSSETSAATLTLRGQIEVESQPLPYLSNELVEEFLKDPKNRDLLVTAGGNRGPVNEVPLSNDTEQLWRTKCDVVGSKYPVSGDKILCVTTPGMNFPGLTVVSEAQIGVKWIEEDGDSTPGSFEFTGLAQEATPSGFKPMVWIYNQLTGANKPNKGESTSFSSLTKIGYRRQEGGESIVFTSFTDVTIQIRFPPFLLKILPSNKEKTEEVGSKSVKASIEKDALESMAALEASYSNFVKEKGG